MRRRKHGAVVRAVAITAFAAVMLTACGGGESSGGPSITVGSKNFPEAILLGELHAQVLEEEGFDVNKRMDLGNVQILDQALQSGEIDMYSEYTGTALLQVLGYEGEDLPSERATYEKTEELYEQRDPAATLLASAPFNNTYAIAVRREVAERYDLRTLADLSEVSQDITITSFGECQQNQNCFDVMVDSYSMDFENVQVVNSLGLRYQAINQGESDATVGFRTDTQLLDEDLVVLEDPKDIWPYYNPTPVIDQSYLQEHPEVAEIVDPVTESISVNDIRKLIARVTLDNEDPAAVAEEYLRENGFIE